MKSAAKLSVYGAALALIVTGAYATGSAVGFLATVTASSGHGGMSGAEGTGHEDTDSVSAPTPGAPAAPPAGHIDDGHGH